MHHDPGRSKREGDGLHLNALARPGDRVGVNSRGALAPAPPIVTKKRGDAVEGHAIAILEGMGYKVEKARPDRRRVGNRTLTFAYDFFKAFDLICLKQGRRTLFVQVTTESVGIGTKTSKIEELADWLDLDVHDVQVWKWNKPPQPGMKGYFRIYCRDEYYKFQRRYTIEKGAKCFPWESTEATLL